MTLDEIRQAIRTDHLETLSWRKTGERFGLNKATARLIARGYKPGAKIAHQLGIVIMLPAPACSKCGIVHVSRGCPNDRQPRRVWVRVPGHAGGEWRVR